MPATNPSLTPRAARAMAQIGPALRDRRNELGLSAAATAAAAGMSRMTLHRIETGSPSVTIGAYLNAAAALGAELTLTVSHSDPPPRANPIRIGDYPQLCAIAWHLQPDAELDRFDALQLYERNWRHVDHDAITDEERQFIQDLADSYSAGILLV